MKHSKLVNCIRRSVTRGLLSILIVLFVLILAGGPVPVPVSAMLGSDEPPEIVENSIAFDSAWGWAVADGGDYYETCTGPCQAGRQGGGVAQLAFPADIGLNANGSFVYVLNRFNSRVDVFSREGLYQFTFGGDGAGAGKLYFPYGIVVDSPHNQIFIADTYNNRVSKYDLDGNFILTSGWGVATGAYAFETCASGCTYGYVGSGDGQFYAPQGIALSPDGETVYVVDLTNDRIEMISADSGTYLGQWGSSGSAAGQFDEPYGIAVDNSGNVYVSEWLNRRIDKFSGSGTFLKAWGVGVAGGSDFEICTSSCQAGQSSSADGGFMWAYDVDVDSVGNVYTADYHNQRIQRFSSEGVFYEKYGSMGAGAGEFNAPSSVIASPDGSLYVADSNNHRVVKLAGYSPLGSVSVTLSEDGAPTAFSQTLQAIDPENDALTWSISSAAGHGTAAASGSGNSKAVSYTPAANYHGSDSFIVRVSDGALTDTVTVNVTIEAVNDAPVISSTAETAASKDELYSYAITASDVDGDTVTITAPDLPAWLSLVDHANGTATLSGTPAVADIGDYEIEIHVSDSVLSGTQTFTLTVDEGKYYLYHPFFPYNSSSTQKGPDSTLLPAQVK